MTTVAGEIGTNGYVDATGTSARFDGPRGIMTDSTYLYVNDMNNNRVRRVTLDTLRVVTLLGSGTGGHTDATGASAELNLPVRITSDSVHLYFGGSGSHYLRKIE